MKALLAVLLFVALVMAMPVYAAKGGVHGKPEAGVSNGSGDKKHPNANNGKNNARPDQDGKGADHGEVNDDKAWDGNNGCGNDKLDPTSPNEDDNNGRCGRHKKPPVPTSVPTVVPTPTPVPTPPLPPATRRVCVYGPGAVEFFPAGTISEERLIGESPNIHCEDIAVGGAVEVLLWTEILGHAGPRLRVTVLAQGPAVMIDALDPPNCSGYTVERISGYDPEGGETWV